MDLRAIGRAMRRQFPVVLVIAIITVNVALSATKDVQKRYEGRASLFFVSSPASYDLQGKPINVNPINLSGNGERVASALVLAMSKSPAFDEQLRFNGARGDVKFKRTSDAILDVKTSAKTPAGAIETLDTAVKLVSDELASTQAASGAPLGTYLKIETLARTDQPREITGSPMKSVGAVVVVGIVLAVAAAMALDTVAPHGIRSSLRWVARRLRGLYGRVKVPAPGARAAAPRPNGPASPSTAPPSERPPTPVSPERRAPEPVPSEPLARTAPAERGGNGAAPTPASTPGPYGGNRQMRRQAARQASRSRGRDPVGRPTRDVDSGSRNPGSP